MRRRSSRASEIATGISTINTHRRHTTSIDRVSTIESFHRWFTRCEISRAGDSTDQSFAESFYTPFLTSFTSQDSPCQYEEYDLDEQDFQWLIAYNQHRIEQGTDSYTHLSGSSSPPWIDLPELDENIFEHLIELLEQQSLLAIRQKYFEDSIHCDACRWVSLRF